MSAIQGKVIIIGAGIGGLTLAAGLSRSGIEVEVYESYPRLEPAGFGLSVNSNASKALSLLGLDAINNAGQRYSSFEFLKWDGSKIAQVPIAAAAETLGYPSYAVGRDELQLMLLQYIDIDKIFPDHEFSHYINVNGAVRVFFKNGHCAEGCILVGADGIHSRVRQQMSPESTVLNSNYVAWLANAEFEDHRLPKGYNCHLWGTGARFGCHDIGGGRKYWWGTKSLITNQVDKQTVKLSDRSACQFSKDYILNTFNGWRDDINQIVEKTPEDRITEVYFRHLNTLRRWSDKRVTLLGDAAHAMMPSLGQGACMAIEDAYELIQALKTCSTPEQALLSYERRRLPVTHRFSKISRQLCFIEQLNNPLAVSIRDFVFRNLPQSFYYKQQLSIGSFPKQA